jgi:hypothetical protein
MKQFLTNIHRQLRLAATALLLLPATHIAAQQPVEYEAEAIFNASTGDYAPYYIASNRHGILMQSSDALLRLAAVSPLNLDKRFSFGFGVEAVAGASSTADYLRYNSETKALESHSEAPAAIFLQQLYGEVKYRGVFLTVGLKQYQSALLNNELSSGDLVESGNSRPIPQARIGFVDFQNIPFTNGWVQIQGEIGYGKFADNDWLKSHYNYYSGHVNLGGYYNYKRCYFRTNPAQPLSVTVGMQAAGMFGGTTSSYRRGELIKTTKCTVKLKTIFKMFLPTQGQGSDYYEGNSLGSWDVVARYRLAGGAQIKAYVQKPWEDGSGIGWLNGFDGVWGLEYNAANKKSLLSGFVAEYIDFTNQSGPIHWSPEDAAGTTITSSATGGDEYYNNYLSNSYANYGMSIGTPFLPSPIYNSDGYMAYVHNRVRGFHLGVKGSISNAVSYRVLGGYRKAWGDGRIPTSTYAEDTSAMAEATWKSSKIDGLAVKAQVAFDAGSIYGDSFGGCLSVSYTGNLNLFDK